MASTVLTLDLRTLRKEAGLKIGDIVSQARAVDPTFPTTHVGYLEIEERGTRDYWKIQALAAVFGKPPEIIAGIVKPGNKIA